MNFLLDLNFVLYFHLCTDIDLKMGWNIGQGDKVT